ncbi:nuclear transport factor 2 family protein [Actinokineospora sp. NPDC004072]
MSIRYADDAVDIPFHEIYVAVQQFYARQMQLFDTGAGEPWAATFTVDAVMTLPNLPEPIRGRAALATVPGRAAGAAAQAGEVHRHWHGMVDVTPRPDGALDVRCYSLVIATGPDGSSRIHRVCVCQDVLVRSGADLLVQCRKVTRDDLG